MNMIRHSDSVARYCSRCGHALEDAASRECGQGPICRGKNNEIFARQIPAEMAKASLLILSMDKNMFHNEINEQFESIRNTYLEKAEKIANQQNGSVSIVLAGSDFRPIIDWFDFALSYPCSSNLRTKIIDFIDCLGYQALAGILRGDVCMSPAKLFVENDKLFLQAKSNKEGFYAMKRSIPNIITPRFRGDKTPYQCSVKHVGKFVDIAYRYWPFLEVSEDVLKALEANKNKNTDPSTDLDEKPLATIITNYDWITVNAPWHGTREEMQNMINQFKSINYKERKYDPSTHNWSFKTNHKEYITDLLQTRYNVLNQ